MLVMIDAIADKFKDVDGLWEKLNQKNRPLISFYFLPLKDNGLTDSLYIKMNSRGIPLTDFEHFKAFFENLIKDVSKERHQTFIKKVDQDWTDMFWRNRAENSSIDGMFMRYFRFVTEMLSLQKSYEIPDEDFDLAALVYGKSNQEAAENLDYLFQSLDVWTEVKPVQDFFDSILNSQLHTGKKVVLFREDLNLFLECCNFFDSRQARRSFSLNNTLLLFGIQTYLMNKSSIPEELFRLRLRILRNLIYNSEFEVREDRMPVLVSEVEALIINGYIKDESVGFNDLQKNQEKTKLIWRAENENHVSVLDQLEDHPLLRGSTDIIELSDVDNFNTRVNSFFELFPPRASEEHRIDYHKISRALLTIGDYSQQISWRYLLGSSSDGTWRALFTKSKLRKGFDQTRLILTELLDSIKGETEVYLDILIESFLSKEDQPKDWCYYFVKYPSMRQGKSGMYFWRNKEYGKSYQYEVYMMNTERSLGGRNWDIFHFTIMADPKLSQHLSLEEYSAPLVKNNGHRIWNTQHSWQILDEENNLIEEHTVPQKDGVDVVDRLQFFKDNLKL